jgi:hypothetical protein
MINLLEVTSTCAAHLLFFNCRFCFDDKFPSTFGVCADEAFTCETHNYLQSVQNFARVLIRFDLDRFFFVPTCGTKSDSG